MWLVGGLTAAARPPPPAAGVVVGNHGPHEAPPDVARGRGGPGRPGGCGVMFVLLLMHITVVLLKYY